MGNKSTMGKTEQKNTYAVNLKEHRKQQDDRLN